MTLRESGPRSDVKASILFGGPNPGGKVFVFFYKLFVPNGR